jgi:hypothetical protein
VRGRRKLLSACFSDVLIKAAVAQEIIDRNKFKVTVPMPHYVEAQGQSGKAVSHSI